MGAVFKYVVVLALGLAVGFFIHRPQSLEFIHGPLSLEGVARLARGDEIKTLIDKAFSPAKPQAATSTIDPTASAEVNEELDYRIAERNGTVDGWRSFLAAHESGAYVQIAKAKLDDLLVPEKTPAEGPLEAPIVASLDSKDGEPPAAPLPDAAGAALTPNEICIRDADRLERLRMTPTSQEAALFAKELGCEKLRPQLVALTASLGYAAPDQAAAENGASTERVQVEPPTSAEIAALAPDETCKRDADRLERLRMSPTSEEAVRFESELGCETLRPQLLALMENLGYATPAEATAAKIANGASEPVETQVEPSAPPPVSSGHESAAVPSTPAAKPVAASVPSQRMTVSPSARSTASLRRLRQVRHASGCAVRSSCFRSASTLPPLLMALFGQRPAHLGSWHKHDRRYAYFER